MQEELTAYKKELSASREDITLEQKEMLKKMYYSLSETKKSLDLLREKLNETNKKLSEEYLHKARKIMYEEQESLLRANVLMKTLLGEEMNLTKEELREIKAEQAGMKERMANWHPVLTKELTDDGIINKGEKAVVQLSIEEMIVNEVIQPKKSHEKYLKMYNKMRGKPLTGYTPRAFVINSK